MHATILNSRTLTRRLTAIKQWHIYQNYSDPTSNPSVRKTLKGIQNTLGKPRNTAKVINMAELEQMVEFLNHNNNQFINIRNRALLLIGFFGAFRRSELVAIHKEYISIQPEGIEILIPRSKTDVVGEGQVCAIPMGKGILCPVAALLQWLECSKIKSGPIFRRLSKTNAVLASAILPNHVNIILKKLAQESKILDFDKISSHSLRRSFATMASKNGASFSAIMRQGRWRHSSTALGYIEAGKSFTDNAANVLLRNNECP